MEVDRKLLERVAGAARLRLSEKEIEKFLPQLREALDFFSKIDEVDTGSMKPSFQPVGIRNVTRDDTEKQCLSQDEALSLAEHKKDGYFKGPKVV